MSVRACPAMSLGSLPGSIQAFTCSFPRITGILSWMKRMDSAGFLVRTVKTGILDLELTPGRIFLDGGNVMTVKDHFPIPKYNLSPDTLRYYERVGVIPEVTRTAGGIRDYQQEDLQWVEKAVCMRDARYQLRCWLNMLKLFPAGR